MLKIPITKESDMKRLLFAPIIALGMSIAPAYAAPPSEQDLEKLMRVMDAEKIVDQMVPVIMSQTNQMLEQSLQSSGADEKARVDAQRVLASQEQALRKMLAWSKLKPIYVRVYADTLSDKEVQALTAFYESPEGRSLMQKLPQIMQSTLVEMQPMMIEAIQSMMQNIEKEIGKN
ncbi:hypothetical protein CO614_07020 [Lysobacteraceae bacterium NML120232]|nr:hypothetical protein CO614_07020 [Xanthomonadaceae bacterium NML120232]